MSRIFLLFLLVTLAKPGALTIYLEKIAYPRGNQVTLGEIATITGADPAVENRLKEQEFNFLCERPTLLPVRSVLEMVRSSASGISAQIILIGERVALIPRNLATEAVAVASTPVQATPLVSTVQVYTEILLVINALESDRRGRIELEFITFPASLSSPAGSVPNGAYEQLKLHVVRAGRVQGHLAGKAWLDLEYVDSSSVLRRETVSFWIHQFLPVARAANDLLPGRPFSERLLEYWDEDISMIQDGFLLEGSAPELFRTTVRVAAGTRINRTMLREIYAVRTGDTVLIHFLRPGLKVSLPGRAFGSGSVGDTVEVKPRDSSGRFVGRIISKKEVLVENL